MNKNQMDRIEKHPAYIDLVKRRSAFGWKLAVLMLVVYYTFIMIIAFKPELLGMTMGGVMTVGIPVGIFIIFFSFILAGIYTKRANGEFDDLVHQIKEDMKGELS